MIQTKIIKREVYIMFSLSSSMKKEWLEEAEKSWLAEAFNSLNRALQDLGNFARGLDTDYFILEKSEIKLNEKGDFLPL